MKIALVCPYDWAYPGGVGMHVSNLSQQFQAMGHRVLIVAPSSIPADDLPTKNLMVIGKPVSVPYGGSVARITVSVHRAYQVKNLLESEEFDIVHIHEPLVSALPLAFLHYSKAINVGTFHSGIKVSRGYRASRLILKRWFRNLHGKIAVSPAASDLVSRHFPGYYNIIPNGIDIAHFSAAAEPFERFKDGKFNIVFVGRLVERRKGLRYLLGAFSRIKWEYPNTRLIIVGPGKPDAASEHLLGERPLKDVEFVGHVPYSDLPRYYRTADIFCAPNIGSESFGIILLEAMAAGAPVVAGNIPGFAPVLEDGKYGVLVPPKDEVALADALVALMQDPARRAHLSAVARPHALEFSWERVGKRVMDYYLSLLDERHSARRFQVGS